MRRSRAGSDRGQIPGPIARLDRARAPDSAAARCRNARAIIHDGSIARAAKNVFRDSFRRETALGWTQDGARGSRWCALSESRADPDDRWSRPGGNRPMCAVARADSRERCLFLGNRNRRSRGAGRRFGKTARHNSNRRRRRKESWRRMAADGRCSPSRWIQTRDLRWQTPSLQSTKSSAAAMR